MTEAELKQIREDLQESIDHFLTVTSDLIETINNHFDKVYGRLKDE